MTTTIARLDCDEQTARRLATTLGEVSDDGAIAAFEREDGRWAVEITFEAVPDQYAAPSGTVTATGLVRKTETRGSFGPKDPATGTLENLARADVARIDQQLDADVLPFYLQLQEQDPAITTADPRVVPAPELDEGPHLSYTIQWFAFSAMTVVFYVLILRRRAREIEREEKDAELDRADPDDVPVDGDPRLDAGASPTPGDTST